MLRGAPGVHIGQVPQTRLALMVARVAPVAFLHSLPEVNGRPLPGGLAHCQFKGCVGSPDRAELCSPPLRTLILPFANCLPRSV
jgi:hypothetical protein